MNNTFDCGIENPQFIHVSCRNSLWKAFYLNYDGYTANGYYRDDNYSTTTNRITINGSKVTIPDNFFPNNGVVDFIAGKE